MATHAAGGRDDHDPRRRVLGAWAEALDQLRVAGVPPRPSATALEFALRYAPAHGAGDAGPALMELARLQSAAMYSPRSAVGRRRRRRVGAGRHDPRPRSGATSPAAARWRRMVRVPIVALERQLPESLQALDELGALGVERAHVGVDVGRDLVDRDEQRELTGVQRVEDLPVVVARPHAAAVGDDAQAREVVARLAHPARRAACTRVDDRPASSNDRTTRNATRSRNA